MTKTVSNPKLRVVPSSHPSPLVRLVDDYLASARASGLSPKTIKFGYGWPLREVFLPWCADNGIASIEQLDNRTCNRFSAHLAEHGGKKGALKPASIWTYSKSVRRFLAWAKVEGEKVNGEVKLPKLAQTMVDVLTPREIEILEQAAQSERDKIIIRLLAETGIRRAELASLTVRDLLEEGGRAYLLIHGKGGRDRKVPVSPAMARRMRRYIDGRPKDVDAKRIFVGLKRRPDGTIKPLSESGITQMVTALGERAGIDRGIHPHTFRHTAATIMLRRGMDSLLVAQILGHVNLQMLQRTYSHLTPTDAHVAMMKVLAVEDQ